VLFAIPSASFTYETNYNRVATMIDGIGTNFYSYVAMTTNGTLCAGRLDSVMGRSPKPFAHPQARSIFCRSEANDYS
jgi:hypothetical protein